MYTWVQLPVEAAKREHWVPWRWNYWQLWAIWHGCWELNSNHPLITFWDLTSISDIYSIFTGWFGLLSLWVWKSVWTIPNSQDVWFSFSFSSTSFYILFLFLYSFFVFLSLSLFLFLWVGRMSIAPNNVLTKQVKSTESLSQE